MREKFLKYSEIVFNIVMIIILIGGIASGVVIIRNVAGIQGLIQGISQIAISFIGVLVVSIIVHTLLSINQKLSKC